MLSSCSLRCGYQEGCFLCVFLFVFRMIHTHLQPAKMTYKSWICYRATIEFREVSNIVDDESARFLVGKWKNNWVTDKESCIFVILDTHGVSYIYNDIVFVTCLLLRGESWGSRKLSSRHWSMWCPEWGYSMLTGGGRSRQASVSYGYKAFPKTTPKWVVHQVGCV